MPIIILEGIDGSGKSTLAKHLATLSPMPATIVHRGPIKTSVNAELIEPLFEVEPDELFIADRWHISELIYGPIYRKTSQIDLATLNGIEAILNRLGAMRIIVQPPLSVVARRLIVRGEEFLQPNDNFLVYAAYKGLADMLGYHKVNTSDEATAADIIKRVLGTNR